MLPLCCYNPLCHPPQTPPTVCLQYHEDNNDPPYDDDYKAIKQMRLDAGTLKEVSGRMERSDSSIPLATI